MKTKIFLSSLLAVSFFMVSCKKELQPQESPASVETAVTDATGTANQQATAQPVNMQSQQQPVVQQQASTQVQPQATATAPGMNPPHGQPNHRCDIAVGAPLNSPPGKNPGQQAPAPVQAQKPVTATPANTTMLPSNTGGTPVAAGVNPPHGMPGHRCDVAVGSPLPK